MSLISKKKNGGVTTTERVDVSDSDIVLLPTHNPLSPDKRKLVPPPESPDTSRWPVTNNL